MTTEVSSPTDIVSLTDSLKERLKKCASTGRVPHAAQFAEIRDEVVEALNLLVTQTETVRELESAMHQHSNRPSGDTSEQLTNRLTDAVDDSLSQWQVQISASFTQAVARELKEQLNTLGRMASESREQQKQLDEQREATNSEMAEALRLKSRYARQRKTLAKEMRAQRAELLCQIERERNLTQAFENSVRQEIEQRVHAEHSEEMELLRSRLVEQQSLADNLQDQLDASEAESLRVIEENARLQSLCESEIGHDTIIADLERDLRDARELLEAFEKETHEAEAADLDSAQQRISALEAALSSAHEELAATKQQMEDSRSGTQSDSEVNAYDLERLELIEAELSSKELEILDLRSQNSDLAAQIARHQVVESGRTPHVSFNQESLTWEERKKLIMHQLEQDEPNAADSETQREIDEIISATQAEIERRDREIEELRSIVEQQANTHGGVAVGAAAIAQMIDSDELVNQERQKLKDIQQEWEVKLRQAEIDLSLERAKLARERIQLESEIEKAKQTPPAEFQAEDGESKAQTRTRKWLEHLGLKDGRPA